MKKWILVLVVVLMAGIGAGIFWQMQKARFSIEGVLPQGALLYVQLRDVEQNLNEMASMPFWQAVRDIDYDLLEKKGALSPQQGLFIRRIEGWLSEVATNPLSKRLFGRDVALAVYPPFQDMNALMRGTEILNPKVVEGLLSGIFLVTRVDPDVQFAELVSRLFNQHDANLSRGQLEYKGEIIHTITISNVGIKFGVVRLKDLLVIGVGEEAARLSVDVFKRDRPALAQDPRFDRVRKTFLAPSDMTGFFDFETFLALLKGQADKLIGLAGEDAESAMAQAQWRDILARMAGFKTLGFSARVAPLMKFSNYLLFEPGELSAEYAPLYTCPPEENKTIRFIPKDVLGYEWSNCFQLDYYWGEIKKELARIESPESKVKDLETRMGLSVEGDILPAFGDEIGGYLSDIQVGGLFPIPQFLLFAEVRNKLKTEQLLSRVKNQPLMMAQEENYKGVPLKYFALPLGEAVQPGYCFLGDYLLVATNRRLLKDSIDASGNDDMALSASPAFQEINFGLTDKNRTVQFARVAQVIEKAKGIVGWSSQWMTAQDLKAQAFKAGSEKPLEEVKAVIAAKEGELKEIRGQIILLEDKIWNMETKGADAGAQKAELDGLKKQLDVKKAEITAEHERREELENILHDYEESAPDPALRQVYLDEVVYPVLEGLKSIRSYGLRATVDDGGFASSVFLKIGD